MTNTPANQTLIFDADDTLWECNKYFEDAIHRFIDFLHAEHLGREEIRTVLDTFERVNGYGARAFARSLVETYRHLATEIDPGDEAMIERLGLSILDEKMETISGVAETLAALKPHHTLFLFTKGDEEEQQLKISRSPLADEFAAHIICHDKTPATYRDIVDSFGLEPAETWMIGNSLRSDIQPALDAGINAIYIPNPHTWHMELIEIAHNPVWPGSYMQLNQISDLTGIFATGLTGQE